LRAVSAGKPLQQIERPLLNDFDDTPMDLRIVHRVSKPVRARRSRQVDVKRQRDVERLRPILLRGIRAMPPKSANAGNGDLIHDVRLNPARSYVP
jgi:hypothetical protein